MYNAMTVAEYIIDYCNGHNSSITNLKVQKLLYFLWIAFYKATRTYLFHDPICAWPLGPVVPNVYDELCAYGGLAIRKSFGSDSGKLSVNDMHIINGALDSYIAYSASTLVDLTHESGKPWDKVFAGGRGRGLQIPFEMIIKDECN